MNTKRSPASNPRPLRPRHTPCTTRLTHRRSSNDRRRRRQLIVNWRNQSADGLALPFLINWLLGDITNLVGCILTHQLPFQTYLATYFCFVDFTLFAQYFYYDAFKPKPRSLSSSYISTHGHRRTRTTSLSRSWSGERTQPGTLRALSAAAANVAHAAAALAASEEALARQPHRQHSRQRNEETEEVMTDSILSEASASRRVTWSQDSFSRPASMSRSPVRRVPHPHQHVPQLAVISASPAPPNTSFAFPEERGRSPGGGLGVEDVEEEERRREREERRRRSSRASRRSASIVFLGVWALFAFSEVRKRSSEGTVLSDGAFTGGGAPPDVSWERVIGRVAAWVCTTLYLTSRLPQIWKNFVRKSTEGLSMALFTFAFLGNAFYVASILTSPQLLSAPTPEARSAFIRESVPYLLGSGGTLVFDVTIVVQSFVYRVREGEKGRSGEEERLLGERDG
ncbi:hypothetical protein EXIGLDRAFT_721027 [Exidia glandulosa HHB12029]|uniref:PQ-loop-domain-containing protein n=1 Tax=Exidia glandulosa HHB12029 TaxID=1314781 RepID=A0A165G1T8_EXIGL|nr:hypothetical protein EXIGLDRAFT_721027 [Exidia glandulosa HHB12029]